MAKPHSTSRGRSPLVIDVELLESRLLLSGVGVRSSLPPLSPLPADPAAEIYPSSSSADSEPAASLEEDTASSDPQSPVLVDDPDAPPEAVQAVSPVSTTEITPPVEEPSEARAADNSTGAEAGPDASGIPLESAGPLGLDPDGTDYGGATPASPGPDAPDMGAEISPAQENSQTVAPWDSAVVTASTEELVVTVAESESDATASASDLAMADAVAIASDVAVMEPSVDVAASASDVAVAGSSADAAADASDLAVAGVTANASGVAMADAMASGFDLAVAGSSVDAAASASGLAVAQEQAGPAVGNEASNADSGAVGSENADLPPGLSLVKARGLDPSAAAQSGDLPPALSLGRSSVGSPGAGFNPGSTAPRSQRLRLESNSHPFPLFSGVPSLEGWGQFDAAPLGMLSIPITAPFNQGGRDGLNSSGVVNPRPALAGKLTSGSGDALQFVRAPGDPVMAWARSWTRHRDNLSPEVVGLESEPASFPVQAMLRDLENLRDQLRSAGEHAIGWLFDREISEGILLAIVGLVAAEITRREFWHAEVNPQWVDDEGGRLPWMV